MSSPAPRRPRPAWVSRVRRGVGVRLPAGWRARLLRRRVSVVVVAEDADRSAWASCVASLREQGADLELLVAPVGAGWSPTAAEVAELGGRLLAPRDTWWQALREGLTAARGDALVPLRACDSLGPGAASVLAAALTRSGADLACARVRLQGPPEPLWERGQDRVHGAPGGPPLHPVAAPAIAGLAVRRAWWRRSGLPLGPDDAWLLSPSLARAYAGGAKVTRAEAEYTYTRGRGRLAFGARPSTLPRLPAWRQRSRLVADAVAGTPLADDWGAAAAGGYLPRLLLDAERATPAEWTELADLAQEAVDGGLRAAPDADARALLWLAAQDRRADVEALAVELAALDGHRRTSLQDDRLLVAWRSVEVPDELAALTDDETPLVVAVHRSARDDEGWFVDLFLRIEHLDVDGVGAEVQVVDTAGRPVRLTSRPDEEANRWAQRRFQSVATGSVRLRPGAPEGPLDVRVGMTAGGLRREARVTLPGPAELAPSAVVVDAVRLDGDALVVAGSGPLAALRLHGADERRPVTADDTEARFSVDADLWGRPVRLGSGGYRLTHPGGVAPGPALLARLPEESTGRWHRLRVLRPGPGELRLRLDAPLTESERGAVHQQRLQSAYAAPRAADPRLVYADCYAGRSATDSSLAVVEELLRRRPELTVRWGVQDHGQWTPPGVEPVLWRSADWYAALASASVVVTNTDMEPWWVRRPGQFLVQTFHGYPSKAMGEQQWQALELSASQRALQRHRGVDTWDLILTPSPEMTRHYREQYGYEGAVHERGYPRNDVLLSSATDELRARARRLLGVEEDQQVVLYAPTWRDNLAVRARAAAGVEHFDVARAAAALGPGYVLALRGHRFHEPSAARARPGSARVVDVTGHPEINELILASDAAVLDYSSLRFDLALVRRPMVFLVPDLAEYTERTRGFLFPFEESAPGPLVSSTDEAVGRLADLPALRTAWADRLGEVNARFHGHQDGHASRRVVDLLLAGPLASADGAGDDAAPRSGAR